MPEFHCQKAHCYHPGHVFRARWACCRCTIAPIKSTREGEPEREEKTHGFIGCNPDPLFTSIDLKVAEWLKAQVGAVGHNSETDGDLLDLLAFTESLNKALRRAESVRLWTAL